MESTRPPHVPRSVLLSLSLLYAVALPGLQAQGRGRVPVELPEGPGKEIVETVCGGGVVRNMMRNRDGDLVIAESGLNLVGLVKVGR